MFFSRAPGGLSYVERTDSGAWDKTVGNFTLDGTWRTLDLSAIVPATAKLVHLRVLARSNTSQRFFGVATTSTNGEANSHGCYCTVVGKDEMTTAIVPIDSGGNIKYMGEDTQLTVASLRVIGWFK